MIQKIKLRHQKVFNQTSQYLFFSPGRINLIGEHIDYNGGLVFPLAIDIGTYGAVSLRNDSKVSIYSDGFSKAPYQFELDDFSKDKNVFWVNYVKGMMKYIKEGNHEIKQGFNLNIVGNIPNGAGLSSSASLELLIGVIIRELNDLKITNQELALLGQKVENQFIELNSGIMDQFAVAMGKKDHAILLNTHNLDYNYSPFNLGEYTLVIGFTNKKRRLAESKYNERYSECKDALKILQTVVNIDNLAQLTLADLEKNKSLLTKVLYRRVKHVVTEQSRVLRSYQLLNNNQIIEFGHLLTEGHRSLQHDYEVSGIELDTLVDLFVENGAIGARQTGAGFGGSMIAVVPKSKFEDTIEKVAIGYQNKIGNKAQFFEAKVADGARRIK